MIEGFTEPLEKHASFVFPNVEAEVGEIRRSAEKFFKLQDSTSFVQEFLKRAESTVLTPLSDKERETLQNTDLNDIDIGQMAKVQEFAEMQDPPRDWQTLKTDLENGVSVKAPIIVRRGDELHLVSGNTRLMVSRALGLRPQVLVVDMSDFKE